MAYTSDDLVTDIQRNSYLTTAQRNFTPAQLLLIADQELMGALAPMLVSLQQGYYEEDADQTCVVGQAGYDFDQYAMWTKLRMLELLDNTGTPVELTQITPEQKNMYQIGNGLPRGFMLENKQIVLYPAPDDTYTLRQKIYRRPGAMVQTAFAAQVLSVVGTTVTYTGAKPSTFTASSSHDFYRGISPFRRVGTAITATGSPGATQQTFAADDAALLQPGDWVCVEGQTVFPDIPLEITPHLSDLVIRSLARTQGDSQSYQIQRGEIVERARAELSVTGNRSVGQPQKMSIPTERTRVWRRRWFWGQ